MSELTAEYGFEVTSPELKTKNAAEAANTVATIIKAFTEMLTWGQHDARSIAEATNKLVKEQLNVELKLREEEKEALHPKQFSKEKEHGLPIKSNN